MKTNLNIKAFLDNRNKPKKSIPVSDTTLLLAITICSFVVMYLLAMLIWRGGFLNPQQFFDLFNNNAYLIVIACGLTVVMITAGIDISVGGTVSLVTMISVVYLEDVSGSIGMSIFLALAVGLFMGVMQGFLEIGRAHV